MMERDEYVRTLVDFIEILPPSIVIERITGEAPSDFFVGPTWAPDSYTHLTLPTILLV